MTVIAGVDVGNATTEVVLVADGKILGSGRVPTRGRKGSADSLRAAAALVRRVERQVGRQVEEARIAPLRAVHTTVLTVPDAPSASGRLRVLAAGVPTPGGTGVCAGPPRLLVAGTPAGRGAGAAHGPVVALVPAGLGYQEAAEMVRALLADGTEVGAVLVAGDEGVLVSNRLPGARPVIDQVDVAAAAACELLAVEVREPGRSLTTLTDPVALRARFGLDDAESGTAAAICRTLDGQPNAVIGLLTVPAAAAAGPAGPWVVTADGERFALRAASALLAGWPPGTIRAFGTPDGQTAVGDLFAVDLSAVAEAATARPGSTGRAILLAALDDVADAADAAVSPADALAGLLDRPVRSPVTEPAASRLGARTTPGARDDALVVDLGAGTIDVIGADADIVVAGAGDLLTAAVAETLGIPRAAADWVKRGPCIRVDGGQRYEAEDGTRGFLDVPAPASAAGMLAVRGPGGLLPFGRRHGPGEWRAMRIRIKQAVLLKNAERAVRALKQDPSQVLVTGGPAGDEELLGVLARALPGDVPIGRGNTGGSLGHRYAVAYGLAVA